MVDHITHSHKAGLTGSTEESWDFFQNNFQESSLVRPDGRVFIINTITASTKPLSHRHHNYEKFFGRPNFPTKTAEMVSPANLTLEEREFLRDCQPDVEEDEEDADDGNNPEDELPDPSTPTAVSSAPVLEDDVEESEPTMDQLSGS